MNWVFREEKKYLIGMAEALQRSHLLGQVMRERPPQWSAWIPDSFAVL